MIEVIRAGLLTTVQDIGRFGAQRQGMPTAGAMDEHALRLANALVDNSENHAVLETTLMGPTLRFAVPCAFAVCGGGMVPALNKVPLELNRAYSANAGDILSFNPQSSGCRAYIAFAGGLGVPAVMGSRSTYIKAGIGGLEGRKLKDGDKLPLLAPIHTFSNIHRRKVSFSVLPKYSPCPTVRVTLGPQQDYLSKKGLEALFSTEYTVSAQSDRMGCRLEGEPLEFAPGKSADIVSDTVCFGSVQVPSGKPIIMMADHQTTGGYAKPCCVIAADIPLVAQLKPGDKLRFAPVAVEEAQRLYCKMLGDIADLAASFKQYSAPAHHMNIVVNGKSFSVTIEEVAAK